MTLLLTAAALMLFGNLLSSRADAALRSRPYGEPVAQPADWALGIGGAMHMIGGVLLLVWAISISWLLAVAGIALLIGNQMVKWGTVERRENAPDSEAAQKGDRFVRRGIIVNLFAGLLLVIVLIDWLQ
jgi:hypothetical protein